jgi:hypothetical protein
MGSLSMWHWILIFGISSIMGIIRAVKNSSILNGLLSWFIPGYGFIYFFVGKRTTEKQISG